MEDFGSGGVGFLNLNLAKDLILLHSEWTILDKFAEHFSVLPEGEAGSINCYSALKFFQVLVSVSFIFPFVVAFKTT